MAAELLNRSHWEAGVAPDGSPNIELIIDSPDLKEQRFSARDVQALPQELYRFFYWRVDERLRYKDIFDYLIWLREHKGIGPDAVAKLLDAEATPLINAGGVPEKRILVYSEPSGNDKKELADAIVLKFAYLESIERSHSDRNAITLLKVKKPGLDQVADIQN